MPTLIDLTGKRFGMLTVLEQAGRKNNQVCWLCRCDCGKSLVVKSSALRRDDKYATRDCGCASFSKRPHETLMDGFLKKVDKTSSPDGCWLWKGKPDYWGYGHISDETHDIWRVHIWSYAQFVGPIKPGTEIHHKCENKMCVNPDHLEQKTIHDHRVLHGEKKRRTVCSKGHELTGDNVRILHKRGGYIEEICKTCERERYMLKRYGSLYRKEKEPSSYRKTALYQVVI
jgi:hypothetical protein